VGSALANVGQIQSARDLVERLLPVASPLRLLDGRTGSVTQPLPSPLSPAALHPARVPEKALLPADADHLLSHCEGDQVDGAAGIVGVVEDVVFDDGRRLVLGGLWQPS
jgi:hypothetical protein